MGTEEYALGQDVTELARGKEAKDTVVLSVRLSREEFARLEKIAGASNRTMSQVVREALARYAEAPGGMGDLNTWVHATLTICSGVDTELDLTGTSADPSFACGEELQKSQGNLTVAGRTS